MAKKDEHPTQLKHLHEHAPTVIHDPEADQTILHRWLRRQMAQGPAFWLWVGGAALLVLVVSIVLLRVSSSRTAEAEAWEALILASGSSNPTDLQVQVGEQGLGAASNWAMLRAAESRYRDAFSDLPQNRDAALPLLKEAQNLFEKVYQTAGDDVTLRRMAAMGSARALEAQGDLDGASQQYERLIKEFPETPEAEKAEELVRILRDPEIIAFYNQFASFKPEEVVLPPMGTGSFELPGLPGLGSDFGDLPGLPGIGGGATVPGTGTIPGLPGVGDVPVPPPLTTPEPTPEADAPAITPEPAEPDDAPTPAAEPDLPEDAFAPTAPEATGTPSDAPAPSPADELPANPFPDR